MRNGFASAVLLIAVTLAPLRARADVVLVDGIAAIVGDTPILLSRVDARVRRILPEVQQRTPLAMVPAAIEVAKKEILKDLINTELVLRAAAEKELTVTNAEIEGAFDSVAQQNKISREELAFQVEKTGMTPAEYRIEIVQQILRGKILSLVVVPRIRIAEAQIRAAYEAIRAKDPAGTPSFEAARAAITQKIQGELLEKGQAEWVEELRRATYIEVRL